MSDLQNKISIQYNTNINKDKIRIAIVGEHIRNHSVWNIITKGIIKNLDKNKFELHIYHLGKIYDEETSLAIDQSYKYNNELGNVEQCAKKIVDDSINVIIYPEIGMHKLTTQLAALRLAKLQLAFWGHPETTGFSTIDYFVSSELIEPINYHNNYTEKVLLLPELGCYFAPPFVSTKSTTKSSLGLSENISILLCPAVSFKYESLFDEILVKIAKQNSNLCFIFFISDEFKSEYLKNRLQKKFEENNLSTELIIFIAWPSLEELYGIMSISTLCLDTIVHSGFNTAISCLECDLPQITYEGDYFRNRQASAILRKIDIIETIVTSTNEYVERVCFFLNDKLQLLSIKEKIKNNKNILFNNIEPIRKLEKFIIDKTNE